VVGNALEHGRHFSDRDHEPKVACRRLAQSNDVNALSVNLYFQMINAVVVFDLATLKVIKTIPITGKDPDAITREVATAYAIGKLPN